MSDGHAGSTGGFAVELAKVGVVLVPIPPDWGNGPFRVLPHPLAEPLAQ